MPSIKQFRAVAMLGVLAAAAWASTSATFTDDGVSSASFTTGSVDIELGDDPGDVHAFTGLTVTNMKPGDVQYAELKIENAGSLGFTYSMSTAATDPDGKGLATALSAGIRSIGAGDTCDAMTYAAGSVLATEGVDLGALVITSRSLSPSAAEYACFMVELPSAAGNALQSATTTATFTFTATQA